ncbi:alkaline phosphatase [Rubrivivax gelatinosus]|uniref:Alkaline phosphatase n=1 Tax=Rubrivivax gelatinosus (strain NBRC 100245 / IL144) TaxID=983917 RepID=I0HWA6_RUBGI|nr:alkaline phosphatase [Rubrivivax gelatinosus]BAL97293.1 alkaline phosphatase [Rubrivivax gelatinosus IL144]
MRHTPFHLAAGVAAALLACAAQAQSIYPLNRADILAGSRFDFKVEFDGVVPRDQMKVSINGQDYAQVFGQNAEYIEREDGKPASSLLLRGVSLPTAGHYVVKASDGTHEKSVNWTVYGTPAKRAAKNVILFIGDGFSIAHRTAARILSKGYDEGGKLKGKLAMDDMPYMALLSTQGTDSIVTDSANSASAYTTGHKSCVNALGVYCSRAADTLAHPAVETITSLAKRRGMAVGAVTNSEVEDATPAAMAAHTRRRSDFDDIVRMFLDSRIDVLMGGGSPHFLPKSTPGSKRKDDTDFIAAYRQAGYQLATTKTEMTALAADKSTTKLLGLYNTGNVDGALDLKFLKKGSVAKFPDQPDVVEEMRAAIEVLSRNPNGFVLMVESARIDKYSHSMDAERAIYDTIMLDDAVQAAKDWSKARGNDTLILVTADHSHPVSLIGTVNDEAPGPEMRNKVGVYASAGWPNYPAPDAAGYPGTVDVSRRLRFVFGAYPDHYDTFRPYLDGENVPAVKGKDGVVVANEQYKDVPGAVLRIGNLPNTGPDAATQGIHSGDDVVLTATGPGAERVRGQMENTELFRVIAEALALAPQPAKAQPKARAKAATAQ